MKNPGVAAFDFDNTLIKNDFGEAVMNQLLLDGLENLKVPFEIYFKDKEKAKDIWADRKTNPNRFKDFVWEEYSSIIQSQGVEKGYRWSSFIFSGWKEDEFRSYARSVWKEELKREVKVGVSPYEEMRDLSHCLVENNWNVFIVTASPEEVIQEVSQEFLIPKENVIGMRLEQENGFPTPRIIEPYTYGEGKVRALFQRKGLTADLAFGDSENDYPLLKTAKRLALLIDKGKKELVEKCEEIHCLIQPMFK
ncbi:MAG TPA: HAD-IB family phosphatase [Leptospiraceae bacterium]|nr:HAD-IB family phosphatase [Leptospiraceae bacterium]